MFNILLCCSLNLKWIGRWVNNNNKTDIEYLFEHGEVINYTLEGALINTPSHYKDRGVLLNSVAGEEGNCLGISL